MSIESQGDLEGMRRVGQVVARALAEMRAAVRPGITTGELDRVAEAALRREGARSAPRVMYGFPGYACISVNEEIVHGVPGSRRLQPGDAVKIDVTAELGGFVADAATTVVLDGGRPATRRLRRTAVDALAAALSVARAGERVAVIGRSVERHARDAKANVIRELCGHGVGRRIHEEPEVVNYDDPLSTAMLTEGLVIAVEPMLAEKPCHARQRADGWTIATDNGCMAVHEEHTVMITKGRPVILTALQ
jgi:methionyl aminopeptidase